MPARISLVSHANIIYDSVRFVWYGKAMEREIKNLEAYIRAVLGVEIDSSSWTEESNLPHFLKAAYGFRSARLLGLQILLMVDSGRAEQPPAVIRKHMDAVRDNWNGEVVYVRSRVTAFHRKRLIEQKVPFVVPGNQMYLPMLGMDLREHFSRLREEPEVFSPSTQTVVLFWLLRGSEEPLVPVRMAGELGYSPMTMSRAFDELGAARLAEASACGKERCLRFDGSRGEVWKRAQSLLRSPVLKRRFVHRRNRVSNGIQAGLSALSRYSILSPPSYETFAFGREDWKASGLLDTEEMPDRNPEADDVEVWIYPPSLFAEKGVVDRLSLYLSLRGSPDERVEVALEEMMRGLPW